MYLGGTSIDGMYLGTQEVQAMYIGDQEVFTAGDIVTLKYKASEQITPHVAYTDSSWTATYSADTWNSGTTQGEVIFSGATVTLQVSAYTDCTGITEFTVTKGVTSIGDQAFDGCYGLTSATINKTVTDMGLNTFFGCSALTECSLPESVTAMAGTFQFCRALPTVQLPSGLTAIGSSLFLGCSSLTGVTIPAGVTSINYNGFFDCTGLTRVEIPSGVTTIGVQAFYNSGIQELTFKGSTPPATVGTDAWKYIPDNGTIYCPAGSSSAYTAWLANQTGPILTWTVEEISLPASTLLNLNAKNYDSVSNKIPVLGSITTAATLADGTAPTAVTIDSSAIAAVASDHLTLSGESSGSSWIWTNISDNPFSRSFDSDAPITFIAKAKPVDSSLRRLFSVSMTQEQGGMNQWRVSERTDRIWVGNNSAFALDVTTTAEPQTFAIIISPTSGADSSDVTITSYTDSITSASTIYMNGTGPKGVAFFHQTPGEGSSNVYFKGDFYWMYVSRSALTPQEIQQVITYNESM